jgi:hypothetical protein
MKQLIWADRVALMWLVLIFVGVFFLTMGRSVSLTVRDPAGAWDVWGPIIEFFVLPPWLVLRALDLIFTGEIRLRSMRAQMESAKAKQQISGRVRLAATPRRLRPHEIAAMPQPRGRPLAPPSIAPILRAPSDC